MSTPFFTIVMPLYNKAPYVRKAVASVVGQTCGDWELVVVDDGSTDGSGDVVGTFDDPRIRLVRQENAGVGAARNRGVADFGGGAIADTRDEAAVESSSHRAEPAGTLAADSSGEAALASPYVCFLDADDWWEPTFLEEMASLIGRYPGAGIYGTGYYIVKSGRKRVAPIGVDAGFAEGEINYCRVYARTLCMPLWTGAVCMPRTVFTEMGGFPVGVRLGEDFLLWVHTALKHKVVLLNRPLSNYNQDVDVAFRGTHHLHAPEHHMLWHLGDLEPLERTDADYKRLVDAMRCYDLWNYHLSREYHAAAAQELAKVDWSRQPSRERRRYRLPLWMARLWTGLLTAASSLRRAF